MKKITVVLSVILALLLSVTAFAATVKPNHSIDMEDHLTDCEMSVEFTLNDVTDKEIFASIYDDMVYDIMDVNTLAVGDVIETSEGDVTVETIVNDDNGLVQINGGLEEGGVTLMPVDEDNCYYEMTLDHPVKIILGMAQLTFADQVNINTYKMTEDYSPAGEGYNTVTVAAADVAATLKGMEMFDGEFSPYATTVTVLNGLLTDITIDFVP